MISGASSNQPRELQKKHTLANYDVTADKFLHIHPPVTIPPSSLGSIYELTQDEFYQGSGELINH